VFAGAVCDSLRVGKSSDGATGDSFCLPLLAQAHNAKATIKETKTL